MSNPKESPDASSPLDRGEQHDVTDLHAAVLREKPDPVEGFEPVNLWVVAGIAGLLFWGGSYLTQYSGRFEANEFSEFPHGKPAPVAAVAADPLAVSRLLNQLDAQWQAQRLQQGAPGANRGR